MIEHNILNTLDNTAAILGISLILCLVVSYLAKKIGLPKVSGFIILGIILGPQFIGLITHEFSASFQFFNDLALGMILFSIGGEFHSKLISKISKKQISQTFFLMATISLISFLLIFLALKTFSSYNVKDILIISSLLAIVAIEAAPPTTLLVIKEYDAKGPLTDQIKIYLALSSLAAITLCILLSGSFKAFGLYENETHIMDLVLSLWSIVGSIILGFLLGVFLTYFERYDTKMGNILFGIIAFILFGQSVSYFFKVNSLILSLILGFTVANASVEGERIHETVKNIGASIYALFFVMAGTHIEISKFIGATGLFSAIYLMARISAIYVAPKLTAKILNTKLEQYNVIGLGLLSHAGVAIAIVSSLKENNYPALNTLYEMVISSIFVFEIAGPLLLKFSLLKSQNIKSWRPIQDKSIKLRFSFRDILNEFKDNLTPQTEEEKYLPNSILSLLDTNIVAIKSDAKLASIKTFLSDNYSIYPVVDSGHVYVGVLDLAQVMRSMTDDETSLTFAKNLIGDTTFIPSNASVDQAREIFKMTQKEVLPVVNPVNNILEGIVHKKDILLKIEDEKKIILSN